MVGQARAKAPDQDPGVAGTGLGAWADPDREAWADPVREAWADPDREAWADPDREAWADPDREAWTGLVPDREAWTGLDPRAWTGLDPRAWTGLDPRAWTDMAVETVQGAMAVQAVQGAMAVEAVQGAMAVEAVQGAMAVEAVQGAMAVEAVQWAMAVEAVQGAMAVEAVQWAMAVEAVQGAMAVEAVQGAIAVEAVQGAIAVQAVQGAMALVTRIIDRFTDFIANPFGFTKQLLGKKRSGRLTCSKVEIDRHLRDTFCDRSREQDLGHCQHLIDPPAPTLDFDGKEPSWKEIQEVIKTARASSAPGPSGVPYKVYKNCPKLLHRLWKILKVIWRRGKVAQQWWFSEGVWIPKEEESKTIDQFRNISLLSVEGKIFFSIVARRLTDYLLRNSYIDTSVQKGGIPKVPGCLEHTGVVTQLIREARENKGDLVVLWLDLTNAYGSIPHKLVEEALGRHHIPDKFRDLVLDYYGSFSLRVSAGSTTSDWHRLEKGIITGCTISVILFALAMNMLVKSAEVQCRGPLTKSGIRQPPIRAFMDDLMVTTPHEPGGRWILKGLEEMTSWARMCFKPAKSRALVLKKGKVSNKFSFTLGKTQIPSITDKPVKSLGKVFDCSLKDTAAIHAPNIELEGWLAAVDKSGLPGKFKAWIYQHGILPRILWPLLIYEVPISTIEGFERRVSRFLRKWLGLPRSLSSIALYGQNNKLKLPISGLSEEFKVGRAREVLQYRESLDPMVFQAGIEVRTGRKWRAVAAVDEAESRLRHRSLIGAVTHGRAGLGSGTTPRYNKAQGKDRRALVQQEVRVAVEEERASRMVGMRQQGAWTRWENAVDRKVTWVELWKETSEMSSMSSRSFSLNLPYPGRTQDNVPCDKAKLVQEWFEENKNEFDVVEISKFPRSQSN
ncbi:uncharacterized protein [Pseudorasbora parva]|uniref:uncharacterized protein n=1 Tax=Pseudorasbora parva TaxID=51549 RepID=UPI00351E9AB1